MIAQYLYNFISASLGGEFPYIEGSDEETQGIIKIKRRLNTEMTTQATPTINSTTKTINTSSYGLSSEDVRITMDNIKNEYKIAWISDLHMMLPDQPTINTQWYNSHSTTFEQRNSMFNNSYLILDNIINCLKENDFDAIVFGGDIMDNYSATNLEYLRRRISGLSGKKVMFLVADHDYLTEMTTNSGENTSASIFGVSGDIKKITIGKDGDSINLVGQNYSNKQITDANVSTINSYLNETKNSLFFTHVPVESKTQASQMQEWSRNVHNGQVYYWSTQASNNEYKNPSQNYLNTLYNSNSLRGVFAGHVHSSGEFELNTGIKEHIFNASFHNSIGVITITPSGIMDGQIDGNNTNTQEIEMQYIGYQRFQEMLQSNTDVARQEIMKYFSLDESWNLCVAKYRKETVDGQVTSYELEEVKIPYRTMTSQYTTPFLFLIDLQLITNNANYVSAVAELAKKQSEIEFTIFDSVTTYEEEYQYTATRHTKTRNQTTTSNGTSGSPLGNFINTRPEYEYSETGVTSQRKATVEYNAIKANVTKAKTWFIDQETDYELQANAEYTYGENGTTQTLEDDEEPSGEGSWDTQKQERWYDRTLTEEWVKSGDTRTKINPSEFMGLWKNDTGTYVQGAPYRPNGRVVAYPLLNSNTIMDRPIINILSAKEELYELLEENAVTQTHAEFMREIIELYLSGDELSEQFGSQFTSIFDPREFIEGSYQGDFDVHDESLFITDLETLKRALQGGYSHSEKLVEQAEAFLNMQNQYKVNALFAASVSITETGAGRTGNAANGRNNWFNIRGNDNGWARYGSAEEGILRFGWQIAEGGYYYTEGNYSVSAIGQIYCPNTVDYPTQADDWIANTKAQMVRFYAAVNIDAESYMTGGNSGTEGTGGVVAAAGKGFRGVYRTASGKEFVEYLQFEGTWAQNRYMSGQMKNKGCTVTSTAVVLSGFGIDKNPEDIRSINPSGISISGVLRSFGLKVSVVNRPSAAQVLQHLRNGNPVIISAGPGYWSNTTGHYFAVLEANGNSVYVSNVGSNTKTGWMDINTVLQQNVCVIFVSN